MYDEFFFPYEKAKLWTRNMVLLSLSHFLLTISLYVMLLVLPLWAVRQWSCSYAEAGAAVAVFGLAMFIPGAFNSYLIDTFKRKSVCLITLLLFIVLSRLYPYTTGIGWVVLLRIVQGGLYSTTTMTTGSTLVIDVTASRRRTDANVAFAWVGRLGMGAGLVIGIYIYPYWDFICVVYVSVIAAALAWLLVTMVRVSFRAPLNPPVLSLDRFILPRALWPGINMMLIAFVFGMLIAHTYNEFFYICVLVGLVMAMVVSKYMLSDASGRSEVELGQAALVGGLLLLGLSSSLICSYIAGVLVGVGVGVSASRFFIKDDQSADALRARYRKQHLSVVMGIGNIGGLLFRKCLVGNISRFHLLDLHRNLHTHLGHVRGVHSRLVLQADGRKTIKTLTD